MSLRLDNWIAIGVLAVLCFAALAHGAVEPWSIALVKLLTGLLVLLWGSKVILDKRLALTLPAATWPLVGLLLLGLAQSFRFTDQAGQVQSLSQDVEATRGTVAIFVAVLVIFLLSANFLAHRERLRVMAGFLTFFGFALSVFALLQHFTWNGKFYWLRPTLSELGLPFGPFANHNHFAGYMELVIGLPIALIVAGAIRREERIFYGFLAAVIGITILFSLSRGGMFSLFVEVMFIALLSSQLPRQKGKAKASVSSVLWRGLAIVVVVIGIFVGAIWIGADPVVNRVAGHNQDTLSTSRVWIWKDALRVFRDHPIAGAGLGSFQTAYPRRSGYDGSQGFVAQAHNDYLQVLADGGMIGGVLALWFLWVVLRDVLRGVRAKDPLIAGLALGSGAGIVGLMAHSLFDFNLQLPSNAMLFLLLCSIASFSSRKVLEQETSLELLSGPRLNAPTFNVGVLR
jgi:O-antigen ligase